MSEPDVLSLQVESLIARVQRKADRHESTADDLAALRELRKKQLRREVRNAKRRKFA